MGQFKVLDIKTTNPKIVSLPIDLDKVTLESNDFIADSYIQKLKAGVFVKIGSSGFVEVASGAEDEVTLGVVVKDADGFANQGQNALATGLVAVLTGIGDQFITDSVKEDTITAGTALYVGTDGVLTSTKGTNKAVAVAISGNSVSNKAILVQLV